MSYPKCLATVLEVISPSDDEKKRVDETARRVLDAVKSAATPYRDKILLIEYEGSYAKGTWLSGEYDLDLFVYFSPSADIATLSSITREIAHKAAAMLGAQVDARYAAHPYYTLVLKEGVEVDLVPAYYIEGNDTPRTPVDRTRLHTRYVLQALKDRPRLRDDIRLFKKLLKVLYIYGAEIEVEGFSGYLCEILILHYGGLIELLQAAAKWRPWKTVIDTTGGGVKNISRKLPRRPLIVLDPVDPRRNAAAAVGEDALSTLIGVAQIVSENVNRLCCIYSPERYVPGVEYPPLGINSFFVELEFPGSPRPLQERAGIAQKQRKKIAKHAVKAGFNILRSRVFLSQEKACLVFEYIPSCLPPLDIHVGPPVYSDKSVEFLEKWVTHGKPVYIIDGRWVAVKKREIICFGQLVEKILSQDPRVSWRVLSANDLKALFPDAYKWYAGGNLWILCKAIQEKN